MDIKSFIGGLILGASVSGGVTYYIMNQKQIKAVQIELERNKELCDKLLKLEMSESKKISESAEMDAREELIANTVEEPKTPKKTAQNGLPEALIDMTTPHKMNTDYNAIKRDKKEESENYSRLVDQYGTVEQEGQIVPDIYENAINNENGKYLMDLDTYENDIEDAEITEDHEDYEYTALKVYRNGAILGDDYSALIGEDHPSDIIGADNIKIAEDIFSYGEQDTLIVRNTETKVDYELNYLDCDWDGDTYQEY